MIGPDDVRAAARVLDGVAHRTPVVTSRTLGEHVVLKPENLQRVGAFKFRGAYNKIASLPRGTDVIGSGTVGGGCILEHGDGRWLQRGDVVELEIEGIGVLRNAVA